MSLRLCRYFRQVVGMLEYSSLEGLDRLQQVQRKTNNSFTLLSSRHRCTASLPSFLSSPAAIAGCWRLFFNVTVLALNRTPGASVLAITTG